MTKIHISGSLSCLETLTAELLKKAVNSLNKPQLLWSRSHFCRNFQILQRYKFSHPINSGLVLFKEKDKLFQATAQCAKATSDYKQDKNEAQQKKAKEVADAKAKGQRLDPRPRTILKGTGVLVNPGKIEMNLRNIRPVVWQRTRSVQGVNAKELPRPLHLPRERTCLETKEGPNGQKPKELQGSSSL